jgi:hypothetical protein
LNMRPTGYRANSADTASCSEQQTDRVQYQTIRSGDTSGRLEAVGAWGYRRCLDFDASDGRGQDYCAVRGGGGFLVGIIADGVSQSYYGDVAAREVSQHLIDSLWERRATPPTDRDLFTKELLRLANEVDPRVQETRPDPTLEEVLAPVREKKGSRAVFAAFVLDFRGRRPDLTLYQVGDIFTWVFDRKNGRQLAETDPNGRWASRGPSDLHLGVHVFHDVTGILLHSDGLRRAWAEELTVPSVSKESFEAEAKKRAAVDDLSFIAIQLRRSLRQKKVPAEATKEKSPRITMRPRASKERSARSISSLKRYWRFHRLPLIGGFVAGFIAGAGYLLLLLLWHHRSVPASGIQATDPKTPPVHNGVPAPGPPPAPAPEPTPAPHPSEIRALVVSAAPLAQRTFFDRFGIFPAESGRQSGDIIAHIEIDRIEVSVLRVKTNPSTDVKVKPCRSGTGCFFVLIASSTERKKEVVFEAVDGHGAVLGRGQTLLQGRQPANAEPNRFLGYYDIHLRLAGDQGGNL